MVAADLQPVPGAVALRVADDEQQAEQAAARGVAPASVLLSDGGGPLYHQACSDDVRARIREAVNALDPTIP